MSWIGPFLTGIEGPDPGMLNSDSSFGYTRSTTSNLLFGNLQHPYQVYSWVPVHISAGDGLNSWPGDKLQQGATGRVPDNLSMTVSISCFSSSARFQFLGSGQDEVSNFNSTSLMRCQSRTANRRITATRAIFFFFGFFATSF